MADFSSVACCEKGGSRRITQQRDGFEASVGLYVDGDDVNNFIEDVVGSGTWPGYAAAIAVDATIEPFGERGETSGQEIIYDKYLITVRYSDHQDGSEAIEGTAGDNADRISETTSVTTRFTTLDYRGFRWNTAGGDPLLEAEAPGFQEFIMVLKRTHFNVPGPLPDILVNGLGKSNNAVYTSPRSGLTFAIETLVYSSFEMARTIKADGTGKYNVSLTFDYKSEGWNTFYNGRTGERDEIFSLETNDVIKPYPPVDLSTILY